MSWIQKLINEMWNILNWQFEISVLYLQEISQFNPDDGSINSCLAHDLFYTNRFSWTKIVILRATERTDYFHISRENTLIIAQW